MRGPAEKWFAETGGDWFAVRFPTAQARKAADKAIESLGDEKMSKYIDTWIAAYRAAGGREPKVED
jgi:hypothetical protein